MLERSRQPPANCSTYAWSPALRENGQLDEARYMAQRVNDFNDPVSHQFFAPCSKAPTAG